MFFKDWRNEACYADTDGHDLIAWAWEFIRRSKKYQACWPCQESPDQGLRRVIKEFGFGAIIDPAYDGGVQYFRQGFDPVFSPSSLDLARMNSKENITVVFDLTKDIHVQLVKAEERLLSEQKKIGLMLPNAKQRGKQWKQYIRLLDAYNSGIERKEGASFFFSGHPTDPRTSYSDALQKAKLLSKNGYKKLLSAGGYKLMS